MTISKMEYTIDGLHQKFIRDTDQGISEPNPYLIDRIENILDRCLFGYLSIQSFKDVEVISQWAFWAQATQVDYFENTYVSIETVMKKSYRVFFLFFKILHHLDISWFSVDFLKIIFKSTDPLWKHVILNLLVNTEKGDIEDLISALPEPYWHGLKDEKCDQEVIQNLQKIVDLDLIFACVYQGRLDILRFFHQNGLDIDIKDRDGQNTLALMSISEQNADILEFVIAEGFSLNAKWSKYPTSELWLPHVQKLSSEDFLDIDLLSVDYLYNQNLHVTEILIKSLIEKGLISDRHAGRMIAIGLKSSVEGVSFKKGQFFLSCLLNNHHGKLCFKTIFREYLNTCYKYYYPTFPMDTLSRIFFDQCEKRQRLDVFDALILFNMDNPNIFPSLNHLFDPKDPYIVRALLCYRISYTVKNRGFKGDDISIDLFNKLFPIEVWEHVPICSVPDQKLHWHSFVKLVFSERKITWSKPSSDPLDKGKGKTLFNRIMIAHLSDQKGSCRYPVSGIDDAEENYEGFSLIDSYLFKVLKKGYQQACASLKQDEDQETMTFFDDSRKHNPDEILQLIRDGKDICYSSGYFTHNIQILFNGPFLVIVDTGIFVKKHAFEIYLMNKRKMTLEWLEKLNAQRADGKLHELISLIDELINHLECKRFIESPFLQNVLFPIQQTVGNCSWTAKARAFEIFECLKPLKKIIRKEGEKIVFEFSDLKNWITSELYKPSQIVNATFLKALERFFLKEIRGIREKTSLLVPDWELLINALMGAEEKMYFSDPNFFMESFADIFELCSPDELKKWFGEIVEPKCFKRHEMYNRIFEGWRFYLERKLSHVEMTQEDFLKAAIEHAQITKTVLSCCPSEYLNIPFRNSITPLKLAEVVGDEELITSLSRRSLSLQKIEEQLSLAKEKNHHSEMVDLLEKYIFCVEFCRDEKPDWSFFISTFFSVAQFDKKYRMILSKFFIFFPQEVLVSLCNSQIKPMMVNRLDLYYILFFSLFEMRLDLAMKLEVIVQNYHELVMAILRCHSSSYQIKCPPSMSPLIFAVLLQDRDLIDFFVGKYPESIDEALLRANQIEGGEWIVQTLLKRD